jgi:polar amino acid transport system substrate-binding protein
MVFSLSACGSSGKNDKLQSAKKSGELVMYTNAEFKPFEFLGPNDQIIGVDVEIGKAIAKKIGAKLVVENAQFDGLVSSIASGKGDVALAGITITDERREEVDFSDPYVYSIQYLIVPEDSNTEYVEDLADKTIGSQTGTTGQIFLQNDIDDGVLTGTDATVAPYNSAPIAMEDLKNGRLQAIVIDEEVAKALAAENEGFKAIPLNYKNGEPMGENFGVAVAKGNEDFLAIINEVIAELVETDQISAWIEEYSSASVE